MAKEKCAEEKIPLIHDNPEEADWSDTHKDFSNWVWSDEDSEISEKNTHPVHARSSSGPGGTIPHVELQHTHAWDWETTEKNTRESPSPGAGDDTKDLTSRGFFSAPSRESPSPGAGDDTKDLTSRGFFSAPSRAVPPVHNSREFVNGRGPINNEEHVNIYMPVQNNAVGAGERDTAIRFAKLIGIHVRPRVSWDIVQRFEDGYHLGLMIFACVLSYKLFFVYHGCKATLSFLHPVSGCIIGKVASIALPLGYIMGVALLQYGWHQKTFLLSAGCWAFTCAWSTSPTWLLGGHQKSWFLIISAYALLYSVVAVIAGKKLVAWSLPTYNDYVTKTQTREELSDFVDKLLKYPPHSILSMQPAEALLHVFMDFILPISVVLIAYRGVSNVA